MKIVSITIITSYQRVSSTKFSYTIHRTMVWDQFAKKLLWIPFQVSCCNPLFTFESELLTNLLDNIFDSTWEKEYKKKSCSKKWSALTNVSVQSSVVDSSFCDLKPQIRVLPSLTPCLGLSK